jgi:hypothetical protein
VNGFFSAIKNKIVWIVIGIIAILAGACLYIIMAPLMYPVFDYSGPPAVLQIQGVEQKGEVCGYPPQNYYGYIAQTSTKALVTASPFSATLKFTADTSPQAIRIQVFDATTLGKPTEESYEGKSYFSWGDGCLANNSNAALTKELDLKNEQTFTLELKRGLYVINVSVKWAHIGQVFYPFLIEVK